ncbi:MAG TPA: hypothetical protein DHU96_17935 [Actinobacteria bacterium]|nr:hypothetical protein [Actinomycetota bacterium]
MAQHARAVVVAEESDHPRCQPVPEQGLPQAAALGQILQDQQVPLLVVLLGAVCTIRPKIRLASADQRRCRASAR